MCTIYVNTVNYRFTIYRKAVIQYVYETFRELLELPLKKCLKNRAIYYSPRVPFRTLN